MLHRFALCFLLVLLILLPWLALGQVAPIAVNNPAPIDGGGQATLAVPETVTLGFWDLVILVLTPLVPALAAHLRPWIRSSRRWMKVIDLIAGNYLAARNDQPRQ